MYSDMHLQALQTAAIGRCGYTIDGSENAITKCKLGGTVFFELCLNRV